MATSIAGEIRETCISPHLDGLEALRPSDGILALSVDITPEQVYEKACGRLKSIMNMVLRSEAYNKAYIGEHQKSQNKFSTRGGNAKGLMVLEQEDIDFLTYNYICNMKSCMGNNLPKAYENRAVAFSSITPPKPKNLKGTSRGNYAGDFANFVFIFGMPGVRTKEIVTTQTTVKDDGTVEVSEKVEVVSEEFAVPKDRHSEVVDLVKTVTESITALTGEVASLKETSVAQTRELEQVKTLLALTVGMILPPTNPKAMSQLCDLLIQKGVGDNREIETVFQNVVLRGTDVSKFVFEGKATKVLEVVEHIPQSPQLLN